MLANSSTLPEARPRASRVIGTPVSARRLATSRAVPSPSRFGLVAMISSRTAPERTRASRASSGELLGPHPLQRGEPAEQDVVDAAEGPGLLQRQQVAGLLDDADEARVAPRVAADGAERLVGLGQVEAGLAVPDLVLDVADRLGEGQGLLGGALQEVVGQPLGGLGPDAGQAAEGLDQAVHRRRNAPTWLRPPRPPGPSEPRQAGDRQAAGQRRDRLGRRLAGLDQALVDGGRHQVFEQLGVAVGQQLRVDPDRDAARAGR